MALPAGTLLKIAVQRSGPNDVNVVIEGIGTPKAADLAIKQQFAAMLMGEALSINVSAVQTLPEV